MRDPKRFGTDRTRELLASNLVASDLRAVRNVEEFGCHIVSVAPDCKGLGWSYTLGIFDTSGKPELVTVGLPAKTAQNALNDAVQLLRDGVDLTTQRHREIVGQVEVVFRPADAAWVQALMGWAKWFHGNVDFPVLQMIYPDLENHFQWEDDFTERFRQPLLQTGVPETTVEEDFRRSVDGESSVSDWKFSDSPHVAAFVSHMVNSGEEAVLYVSHDADGDWQFLGRSMADEGGPVVVCLHHPIDRDKTLEELWDLPLGWCAERVRVGEPWVRGMSPVPEETDDTEV